MRRDLIPRLPYPIARALNALLNEEVARSADELSELLVAVVEYVAAVALCDYLDGSQDPEHCARDASLNGWLVAGLGGSRGVEAGLWARWTQRAIRAMAAPQVPALVEHVSSGDLDDPGSDLSALLAFRNAVMHGGFVAPLVKIREATQRLERVFARLEPLWELEAVGCVDAAERTWVALTGLTPRPVDPPSGLRAGWDDAGSVVLVGTDGQARLALHPACTVSPQGRLDLQHAWKRAHLDLFSRPAIRGFFDRYNAERAGQVNDDAWWSAHEAALPEGGYRSRAAVESELTGALKPGAVVRVVGPWGSGRSSLMAEVARRWAGAVRVLPVQPDSVRMDPDVVRRWASTNLEPRSLLVVDDAGWIGTGLYAEVATRNCFTAALTQGATVVVAHLPSQEPPVRGDAVVELSPWSRDELKAWGDPEALWQTTGGHPALLVDPEAGLDRLARRLAEAERVGSLPSACLRALVDGDLTAQQLAERMNRFTPEVERVLRGLLDWIRATAVAGEGERGGRNWRYALRPEVRLCLMAEGGA